MTFCPHLAAFGGALFLLVPASGCIFASTERALESAYGATSLDRTDDLDRSKTGAGGRFDFTQPLDRAQVIAGAVAENPALSVLVHRARALVHAGRAEGSMPPVELAIGVTNLPLPKPYALDEADMYMVEVRQRIPAAGSLDAGALAMAEEAHATLAELRSEERRVAEQASNAFTDYAKAHAEAELLERQLSLLARMREAVGARLSTGGSFLLDAARIDVAVAKIERDRARRAGERERARATLSALLRRAPDAPLGAPVDAPAETVRLTATELIRRAETRRGGALAADAKVRAAKARASGAEAIANVPEFMVGLGYWQDPTMRPGFGVSASMSLPWLWGPGRDRVRQADEEESAERAARKSEQISLETEVTEAHATLVAIEAELTLIDRRSIPSVRRSQAALTAAVPTGDASLVEWIELTRELVDLEMERVALRADLERSVAALERAVGETLPKTPLEKDHDR